MIESKICCFGELLLRFDIAPTWPLKHDMAFSVGGAELNVATALAHWGLAAEYVTVLPDNFMSTKIIHSLQNRGVGTDNIILQGKRTGIYFLPEGGEVKSHGVIYDREHSSFSGLMPGTIDWDVVFSDCKWVHFTAISPALNHNVALVCKEALDAAVSKGITISVDLNFRSKLWQYGQAPFQVMPDLVACCDIIMGNMWSAESLLGIQSTIKSSQGLTQAQIEQAATNSIERLKKQFPKAYAVAYTQRLTDSYWGILNLRGQNFISGRYDIDNVTDQVGSGDCFMAGLLYALYHNFSPIKAINFASSAAVGKLLERGDATRQSVEEITKRLQDGTV